MTAVGSQVRMRKGGRALLVMGLFLGMAALLCAEDGAPAAQKNLPAMSGYAIPGQPGLAWRYAEVMIEWGSLTHVRPPQLPEEGATTERRGEAP